MAGISSAAIRYAEAFYSLAVESNQQEQWIADLGAANEAFGAGGGQAFLVDRKISPERKFEIIDQALAQASPQVRNLVKLLAGKGRGEILPEVVAKVRELWDEARGVAHARVTTAVALDDGERSALAQRLSATTGKQVEIDAEVDPEILGGIVVRLGDKLIDGSARSRLRALKRQLEGSAS
jgi:F-type H+-transporting ATPase subunit delta